MYFKNKTSCFQIAGILASVVFVTSVVGGERDRVPGYVTGSDGTIMHSGNGECIRSSDWAPKMATVVGCDGVVLKAPIETKKGQSSGVDLSFVIPSASMFGFDSSALTVEGKQDLQTYRAKIQPEIVKAYAVMIIGHTDNKGSPEYNHKLSHRRAATVRDFMIAGGITPKILRIAGWGAKDPIASNDTAEGRSKNRRVEVIVFGEARELDIMRFPSVALFPRKSSELTLRGKQLLDKNKIKAKQDLARAVYIEIIGHTDDVGDKKENQALSEKRAEAVRTNLIKAGVDPYKIATVGAGSSLPIASNQTEEGRAQNRRVEVLVLGRIRE